MNLYRATYWPGTARMSSEEVAAMSELQLANISRRWEFRAVNWEEANRRAGDRLSGTSDGCLLEQIDKIGGNVIASYKDRPR